jgi:hypothetical protein
MVIENACILPNGNREGNVGARAPSRDCLLALALNLNKMVLMRSSKEMRASEDPKLECFAHLERSINALIVVRRRERNVESSNPLRRLY